MRLVPALLCLVSPAVSVAADLTLSHVHHQPMQFDPAKGESLMVRFRLSGDATVRLNIYDGRDLRVHTVISERVLSAGDHVLVWDGKAFEGRPVPPEAYVYTLEALDRKGEPRATWDPGDLGETTALVPLTWEPTEGVVRYRLPAASRVRIRIGLEDNGPLLRTLLDWVPRPAGAQEEPWDGLDAGGVLDLGDHPRLALVGQSFPLSRNAVLVGSPPRTVELLEDVPESAISRPRFATGKRRMFDYARQPIGIRRDYPVKLVLTRAPVHPKENLPIVSGPTSVRVEVEAEHLPRVLDERLEAVFFVDGRFVFETEVGFLPLTWTWDPKGANPGPHYITVNLRGYDGHFGITTTKVLVADEPLPPLQD